MFVAPILSPFSSFAQVGVTANDAYFRPAANNSVSVDVIIKTNMLVQVARLYKRTCKQKALHDVLESLGDPQSPQLYFAVPPRMFDGFRYQKYLDSKRRRMAISTFVNVRKIQQFALEIKLCAQY